jgi:hypothetical protein
MEKPKHSVLLSPEAIMALRQIIHGATEDRSPSSRAVALAIDSSDGTPEDRGAVLLVVGLADEAYYPHKRHVTLPT